MIKHIVMWKLKEVAEGHDKPENARLIKANLEALQAIIPEIRQIEVGINMESSDQAYDLVLYSVFDTVEDLSTYQHHPEHLKVSDFIGRVRDTRVVADYEV